MKSNGYRGGFWKSICKKRICMLTIDFTLILTDSQDDIPTVILTFQQFLLMT